MQEHVTHTVVWSQRILLYGSEDHEILLHRSTSSDIDIKIHKIHTCTLISTLSDDLDNLIRYVLPLPVSISPQDQVLTASNLTL